MSWFLLESDRAKMFKAVGNYLSLGQFELARALIRIHHQETPPDEPSASVELLLSLIRFGPPDNWVVSNSVPSTAHLLSMCVDILDGVGVTVPPALRLRCDFDLTLAQVFAEANTEACTSVAALLRTKYMWSVSQEAGEVLPRLLIRGGRRNDEDDPLLSIVPPTTVAGPSEGLSAEMNEWVFDICRSKAGAGLIQLLHTISPLCSTQISHIQVALVVDALSTGWSEVWRQTRFLGEFGNVKTLTGSPIVADLLSLLVLVSNSADPQDTIIALAGLSSKLVSDALSVSQKKRRALFALSAVFAKVTRYLPNESLRRGLFEALWVAPNLIDLTASLEDELLELQPAQFTHTNFTPHFWDAYLNFLRVAKVHCLEYPLTTSLKLVMSRDFGSAEILLKNFNQLKPLTILLCWDQFGSDVDARTALLASLWVSYTDTPNSKAIEVENFVRLLVHRFETALLVTSLHRRAAVIDVLARLPRESLLKVLRPVLREVSSEALVSGIGSLPRLQPSAAIEVRSDLDVTKAYFAIRQAIALMGSKGKVDEGLLLAEVDSLCGGIVRAEVRVLVLGEILNISFSPAQTPSVRVFVSLVCLVCKHASGLPLARRAQSVVLRLLLGLRQAVAYGKLVPQNACKSLADWAGLVGADPKIAMQCDVLLPKNFPPVTYSPATCHVAFTCPPRFPVSLRPDKLIARLRAPAQSLVDIAHALNDYSLAEAIGEYLGVDWVGERRRFAQARVSGVVGEVRDGVIGATEMTRNGEDECGFGSAVHEDPKPPLISALFLADLSVCSSDQSLPLLDAAQKMLSPGSILSWANRMAVLLETKSEFADSGSVELASLVLGIETLPTEPELLKDHLSRLHSQRAAIMSLVDRVDQVRHGRLNEATGQVSEDLLSDAIRTLTSEGVEGLVGSGGGSSLLIQFLEYLSKLCVAAAAATDSAVSLFDVLSEEPADLVARLVFRHSGFVEARQLAARMQLDLLTVVTSQSLHVRQSSGVASKISPNTPLYFISLPIVQELAKDGDERTTALLCVERRSEKWPSLALMDFAVSLSRKNHPVCSWIVERRDCWLGFVDAFRALHGNDVSGGFSLEEENELEPEIQTALRSVAEDSQFSMNALARFKAKAHMAKCDFIAALSVLDESLDAPCDCEGEAKRCLTHTALRGCLKHSASQLSPDQIYELLWRLDSSEELVGFVREFIRQWDFSVALKALELCGTQKICMQIDRDWVELSMRVIRTMAAVVQVCPQWDRWQRLDCMTSEEECVAVIEDLLLAHHHAVADEFLALKTAILTPQIDTLADRIELSRLRFMYIASEDKTVLLDRFRDFHHPVKASRLSLELMGSLELIQDRVRLGQLLLANGIACDEDCEALETQLASLALLSLTGSPTILSEWAPLMGRPDLIFESLLLNGKTRGMGTFLAQFPCWRNDGLLLSLARKALGIAGVGAVCMSACTWGLTGDAIFDRGVRQTHQFSRIPDVPLALKLMELCDSTQMTEEAIWDFADSLSLFVPEFIAGRQWDRDPFQMVPLTGKCPFTRVSFLRQAILSMLRLLRVDGRTDLRLLSNLWAQSGIRIGLRALRQPEVKGVLRDLLFSVDQLDLAERVDPDSAGVVRMRRAELRILAGDLDAAKQIFRSKVGDAKNVLRDFEKVELSLTELRKVREALAARPSVSLDELQRLHQSALLAKMDSHLHPNRKLGNSPVPPSVVLSHVHDTADGPQVVLAKSHVRNLNLAGARAPAASSILGDLLAFCKEFGAPNAVLVFLFEAEQAEVAAGHCGEVEAKHFIDALSKSAVSDEFFSKLLTALKARSGSFPHIAAIAAFLRNVQKFAPLYAYEVALGREVSAALVCVHLYLRGSTWEERIGWLESARRHLEVIGTRTRTSSSDEEEDFLAASVFVKKISVPFPLPLNLPEAQLPAVRTLVSLQLQASAQMPTLPASASLFGSVQSVSELVDYLLMDNQVALAKSILGIVKLPDSALCGIFDKNS